MDIKKIFEEYKWVLVFAVVAALAAGIFAWQGAKYSASQALTISRSGTQSAADYKYDNYYALKAGDEFGSVVEGWFKTPEMTQAIYKKANLNLGAPSLADLSRSFQAAKISAGTVEVRFGAASVEEAKNIGRSIVAATAEKANELSSISSQGVAFSVVGGEPVVIDNSGNIWRNALVGLIMGLIFGIFVKAGKEYFSD
jgi:hypothetical protein